MWHVHSAALLAHSPLDVRPQNFMGTQAKADIGFHIPDLLCPDFNYDIQVSITCVGTRARGAKKLTPRTPRSLWICLHPEVSASHECQAD